MVQNKSQPPVIGVLALQGAVDLHQPHIESAGGVFARVKTADQINECDGFILPGGESSTMLKLIDRFDLWDVLVKNFAEKPVWGICAGAILMAKTVTHPTQKSFGLLDITIWRNGYGSQIDSHDAVIDGYDISYIRAPIITHAGSDIDICASHQDSPVWVRQNSYMATTFHPELNRQAPSPMHHMFIDMCNA